MNIKDASKHTGLPSKTIRYYEDIGLVEPARLANGYRDFSDNDLEKLAFIGRGRALGFSIDECRSLLALYEDRTHTHSEVRSIARAHLKRIDQKIKEMQQMRATLNDLVKRCNNDDRPDCPILLGLAGD
ncbi:Cu(I)-responsive transcriptional regulator [Marivivens niveibacter]|uniref:Cu(I)-responsive transcriptional regulator n=1 Tax=Marivivens niveibacter TaxID=1930667 RepID=A0A251X0N3_9RHOB|nr:MerR family DNA-binding protein [Marivivens niveibacter]OUD10146.1 Cu(I)-responsive transcriptional regulator [Marivivens niveibacter]